MRCAGGMRDTAWSRCASAAAWALPESLNAYDNSTFFAFCVAQGRLVAARRDASRGRLHAGEALRRAPADGKNDDRVRGQRGVARSRTPRGEGLAAGAIAGPPLW